MANVIWSLLFLLLQCGTFRHVGLTGSGTMTAGGVNQSKDADSERPTRIQDDLTTTMAPNKIKRKGKNDIHIMQWNVLADGLAGDGFTVCDLIHDKVNKSEFLSELAEMRAMGLKTFKKFKAEKAFGTRAKDTAKALGQCAMSCLATGDEPCKKKGPDGNPVEHACAQLPCPEGICPQGSEAPDSVEKWPAGNCEHVCTFPQGQDYWEAMEKYRVKFHMQSYQQGLAKFVDWGGTAMQEQETSLNKLPKGRGETIVKRIIDAKPDILAVQELDHMNFFERRLDHPTHGFGMACTKEEDMYVDGIRKWYDFTKDREECVEEGKEWTPGSSVEVKYARAHKEKSNSAKFHLKSGEFKGHHDDDGPTLFWNSVRFQAKLIKKACFKPEVKKGKKIFHDGGVVGALLQDQQDKAHYVLAFTTHLASGYGDGDKQERLEQITTVIAPFVQEMKKNAETLVGPKAQIGVLFMMDGNAHPMLSPEGGDPAPMFLALKDESIMGTKLAHFLDTAATADDPTQAWGEAQMKFKSVHKMRGVGSVQLNKVGDYEKDLKDYILYDRAFGSVAQLGDGLPILESKGPVSCSALAPSNANPSDHFPVLITASWNK